MSRKGIKSPVGADLSRGASRATAQSLVNTEFTENTDYKIKEWVDWQPTITLAGATVTPFIRYFKYKLIGDCCFVNMRVEFNVSVAGADVLITHPFPPINLGGAGAVRIIVSTVNAGAQEVGVLLFSQDDSRVIARRIPAANWTNATQNVVQGNYFYLCKSK